MTTVMITGAARGLGFEFTRLYAARGWKVLACARKPDRLKSVKGDVQHHLLEVTDYKAVTALAQKLEGETIDILICNAGIAGRGSPGQEFGAFDAAEGRRILEINTVAPLMMAEAFADHVSRSEQKKMIAITSVLGSLANNNGGRYFYRASKAALNMEWNCLAMDLAARGVTCVALHPGWVQTDMGGPTAPLTIDQSVPAMVKTIDGFTTEHNGRYIQYDGAELAW